MRATRTGALARYTTETSLRAMLLLLLLLLSLPSQRHDAQLQVSSPEGSDTQHKSGTP